ncbi:MAG: hypothetical protein HC921_17105 [Synechococcaceae cyanobacterium SM2_3_1]|nr:hypothetical protein [Synechococcaceae cyanobacterium SM2_3_1]
MVQDLQRLQPASDFPESAPSAYPVFYRTYSRRIGDQDRETWQQVCERTIADISQLGQLTAEETALLQSMQRQLKALASGRALWVMGTDWIHNPANFSGAYNCTSTNVSDWRAFGLMMDLAMMGCGTGAVLEPKYIGQLPPIRNPLHVRLEGAIGTTLVEERREETEILVDGNHVRLTVGDSRRGWVKSYQTLLELASSDRFTDTVDVVVDLSDVRPAGEKLKGFGGVANPIKLTGLYERCTQILNRAVGRQLNSVECCLLIDEAAACVVAGNIRRCLPEDALVHTDQGLVPIKDLQVGDRVQTPLGFRRVTDKFDQGIQDVFEIETNGPLPRATLNHRMAVLVDAQGHWAWKSVAELEEGDRLLHNTQRLPGTVTTLPTDLTEARPEQSFAPKPITIPPLTPDVAWLIGYTHGDGYVALGRNRHAKPYGRVEWGMNGLDCDLTRTLREKLDRALAKFGLKATHGLVRGEHPAKSVCTSIRLAEYFYRYVKKPGQPLSVPTFILQGSVDIRAAYLAGLMDSDGAIHNRPPDLLTTIYPGFARQVTAVLSSLGIAGCLSLVHPQPESWQVKYNVKIPALKSEYNRRIAPHSVKGELRQGLTMHGFTVPGTLVRASYAYSQMRAIGFEGSRAVDSNFERYQAESEIDLDIPVTVKGLGSFNSIQTYDIEVEEAHCFYCDGYLTHNSAGMRQFDSEDQLASTAKDNLWQQDDKGNWRIDPERDSLRMANHTHVFHQKPTLQESIEAVRKQYYSGEGAIQWAGEAVARSNRDLVPPEENQAFIAAYVAGEAKQWLLQKDPSLSEFEINDRISRYGLNPCITSDVWIHTGEGPRQVKDLIGKQHSTYVNGELFSTTPEGFFYSGTKPVFKLVTQEGYTLRLTGNHKVLKVTTQTQKSQYAEWIPADALNPGDRILLHNHRGLQPWDGEGSVEAGWLLGNLVGDGSIAKTQWNDNALLRYWGDSQHEMSEHAITLLEKAVAYERRTDAAHYHVQLRHLGITSAGLAKLAASFGIVQGKNGLRKRLNVQALTFTVAFSGVALMPMLRCRVTRARALAYDLLRAILRI